MAEGEGKGEGGSEVGGSRRTREHTVHVTAHEPPWSEDNKCPVRPAPLSALSSLFASHESQSSLCDANPLGK